MLVALPVEESQGGEIKPLSSFKGAPLIALLVPEGEGVKVNVYQNPASSGSELAQLLLSFGVKKLVYPKVSSKEMLAFQALGLEVITREFSSLEEAIYGLFG
jgi:predicted Fe-Mo cluster-binding NifX family protein